MLIYSEAVATVCPSAAFFCREAIRRVRKSAGKKKAPEGATFYLPARSMPLAA